MKRLSIILVILAISLSGHAQSIKQEADAAYAAENFAKASKLYEKMTEEGMNAEVCYNLGCCYYRMDNMAKAVLWLERAAMMNPSDDDIQFNLDMARTKTIDRITPRHEMFFVSAWNSISNTMSVDSWALLSVVLFAVSLVLLAFYIFSTNIIVRKTGFFGALVGIILVVLGNLCAYTQKVYVEDRTKAVIMTPAVTVKSTPSLSGNDLFVIHEGTRVDILDNGMKEWVEVQIADGKVGWMQRSNLEII